MCCRSPLLTRSQLRDECTVCSHFGCCSPGQRRSKWLPCSCHCLSTRKRLPPFSYARARVPGCVVYPSAKRTTSAPVVFFGNLTSFTLPPHRKTTVFRYPHGSSGNPVMTILFLGGRGGMFFIGGWSLVEACLFESPPPPLPLSAQALPRRYTRRCVVSPRM